MSKPDRQVTPPSPEFSKAHFEELVWGTYEKMAIARRKQTLAEGIDANGGRPFIAEGVDNEVIPAYHLRFGLQPHARIKKGVEGVENVIIRVALAPSNSAPVSCLRNYSKLQETHEGLDIAPKGFVPTSDICVETIRHKRHGLRTDHFFLTPSGLTQYSGPTDIGPNLDLNESVTLGRLLDLNQDRPSPSWIREASLSTEAYWEILRDYNPFPQEANPPYVKTA